jgi:hypothetical protein
MSIGALRLAYSNQEPISYSPRLESYSFGAVVCSFDNNIICDFEAGLRLRYPPRGECLVVVGKMPRGVLVSGVIRQPQVGTHTSVDEAALLRGDRCSVSGQPWTTRGSAATSPSGEFFVGQIRFVARRV